MSLRDKFRRRRDGTIEARFDEVDEQLLRAVLSDVLELLDDGEAPTHEDPLAAALGIGVATTPPDDPALRRLLPDAYADDEAAAGEFRRYTERGLRERKRTAARVALASLDTGNGVRELDEEQALAWLGALNDVRLALGTRIGVSEDWDERAAGLADDDPLGYAFAVYDHLTWLQELLVQAIGEPSGGPGAVRN
ncbi:DUF2017 domain-containing protein [Motilibacter aurantiacus]|uniref:DUF2017 domain-containing protein n=1 Tax=Motilibacter aurantiacus TaxID=2714955 RepID=UPI00140B8958|nr:DUF2017 domain-containing protein [Motilibacter aurantiacus]NHC45257.1 DUF2017 domain-containing protein [Motilibacter aurantiacus]